MALNPRRPALNHHAPSVRGSSFFSAVKAFDGPETLVQRNAHKDNISVLISFGQFLEVRDFGTTRWAPGRPEVEHLNLAFELVGMCFTSFQIDQLPLRRPLADLGIVFRGLECRALGSTQHHPDKEASKGACKADERASWKTERSMFQLQPSMVLEAIFNLNGAIFFKRNGPLSRAETFQSATIYSNLRRCTLIR